MPDETPPDAGREGVFRMDPESTLWSLARQLVSGQRSIAALRRNTHDTSALAPDSAHARKLMAEFERLETDWYDETLPNLVAAMRLAIEVFDTFGPGPTTVDDSTDAVS